MTLHLELWYDSSVADTTLEAMTVVDNDRIRPLPNPAIRDICPFGANLQYVQVTAPSLPNNGIYVQMNIQASLMMAILDKVSGIGIAQNDQITVNAYQDSGAGEAESTGILFSYGARTPYRPGRLTSNYLAPTSGNAVWGASTNFTGLDARKRYQILMYSADGTANLFVKFLHPSFGNLTPGGPAYQADVKLNNAYKFPLDDVPTFEGAYPPSIQAFGDGNAVNVAILLNEL